jgi:uncharacterized protein
MSQENVEVVRRAFASFSQGGVPALLAYMDEDIDWVSIPGFLPDARDHRGHDGVVRWFERIEEVFADPRWELEEVIEAGPRVFVASKLSARGQSSGAPVETPLFHVVTLVHARAVRFESYLERSQALEAAGLPASDRGVGRFHP